jgi:hypothetical protein
MQPEANMQPSFFDLVVQRRGDANRVLETIAEEVEFGLAEERVAVSYSKWWPPRLPRWIAAADHDFAGPLRAE